MAQIRVVLDPVAIKNLLSNPQGAVYQDMRRRGNAVKREATRLAPKDQGTLKQSMAMEMSVTGDTVVVRVGTNLKYGLYIHEGTANKGQGYIYPRKGTFLKWPVKNNSGSGRRRYKGGATAQYAYAKRVRGIKPNPYLRNALPAAGR
jgi:hypothetical protein